MKVISFLCLLLSLSLSGQSLVLEPAFQGNIYVGSSNYFQFLEAHVPCDSVWVVASNGRVKQDSCRLEIVPAQVGATSLSFYNISNQDTTFIATRVLRVKHPKPQLSLYLRSSGNLSKNALIHARLEAKYTREEVGGCGVSATIISYRVVVLRGDSLVGTMNVEAAHFTDEVKSIFEKMERDDKVYFMDIWATSPLGDSMKLTDVSFGVE